MSTVPAGTGIATITDPAHSMHTGKSQGLYTVRMTYLCMKYIYVGHFSCLEHVPFISWIWELLDISLQDFQAESLSRQAHWKALNMHEYML